MLGRPDSPNMLTELGDDGISWKYLASARMMFTVVVFACCRVYSEGAYVCEGVPVELHIAGSIPIEFEKSTVGIRATCSGRSNKNGSTLPSRCRRARSTPSPEDRTACKILTPVSMPLDVVKLISSEKHSAKGRGNGLLGDTWTRYPATKLARTNSRMV